jgi:antitoxin component YwqK of YwqJK toxin-antitoxin module
MKKKCTILIVILIGFRCVYAQSFGCYEVSINEYSGDVLRIGERSPDKIYWADFSIVNYPDSASVEEYYAYKMQDSIPMLKMKGNIRNQKREGKWILYSMNHNLKMVGGYLNDRKCGEWRTYSKQKNTDTFLSEVFFYKEDTLHGEHLYFSATGDTIETETWKNGMLHGVHARFANNKRDTLFFIRFDNGLKNGRSYDRYKTQTAAPWNYRYDVGYTEGRLSGDVKIFHPQGNLFYEMIYRDNLPLTMVGVFDICGNRLDGGSLTAGTGTLNFYSDSGKLVSSFNYKNQEISGEMVHYYVSGRVMEKGILYTHKNEQKPVEAIILDAYEHKDYNLAAAYQLVFSAATDFAVYAENGAVQTMYQSIGHRLSDTIQTTDYNENKTYAARYYMVFGGAVGLYERYDENGLLESAVNYKMVYGPNKWCQSVKDGEARFFYKTGILKAQLFYKNNAEVGAGHYYNDEGKLVRTQIHYANGATVNIFNGDTVCFTDSLGQKQGKWLWFGLYECTDKPRGTEYYLNGQPIGEWIFYNRATGGISEKQRWIDSTRCYIEFYFDNGRLRSEGAAWGDGPFNSLTGNWRFYNEKSGFLEKEGIMDGYDRVGEWVTYTKKGKRKKIQYYVDGKEVKNTKIKAPNSTSTNVGED